MKRRSPGLASPALLQVHKHSACPTALDPLGSTAAGPPPSRTDLCSSLSSSSPSARPELLQTVTATPPVASLASVGRRQARAGSPDVGLPASSQPRGAQPRLSSSLLGEPRCLCMSLWWLQASSWAGSSWSFHLTCSLWPQEHEAERLERGHYPELRALAVATDYSQEVVALRDSLFPHCWRAEGIRGGLQASCSFHTWALTLRNSNGPGRGCGGSGLLSGDKVWTSGAVLTHMLASPESHAQVRTGAPAPRLRQ